MPPASPAPSLGPVPVRSPWPPVTSPHPGRASLPPAALLPRGPRGPPHGSGSETPGLCPNCQGKSTTVDGKNKPGEHLRGSLSAGDGGFLGEEEDGEDGRSPGRRWASPGRDRRDWRRRFRLMNSSTDPEQELAPRKSNVNWGQGGFK